MTMESARWMVAAMMRPAGGTLSVVVRRAAIVLHLSCAGAAVAVLPECGGGISSVCDDLCECTQENGSDDQVDECFDDCVREAEKAEATSEEAGCESEHDAVLDCVGQGTCDDGSWKYDCAAEQKALTDCGGSASIGDPCQAAVAKLDSCGFATGGTTSAGACTGAARCAVECINQATCAELDALFKGGTTQGPVFACISACTG